MPVIACWPRRADIVTKCKLIQNGITAGGERMFGEYHNINGSGELRMTQAGKDPASGKWSMSLQDEKIALIHS
jgi:hypothetical protein